MMKGKRNETKQTVQFKLEYTMLFNWGAKGSFYQLPINVLDEEVLTEDNATLN